MHIDWRVAQKSTVYSNTIMPKGATVQVFRTTLRKFQVDGTDQPTHNFIYQTCLLIFAINN